MRMKKTILSSIIGIILLAIIFYAMGVEDTVSLLAKTDLYLFLYAGVAFLFMELALGFKLKILLPSLSIKGMFLSHQGGMFLSNMTPGRAGYFYAAYSVAKRTGTSISKNIGMLTLIQGLTMITKIVILCIAFVYLSFIIEVPSIFLLAFAVPLLIVFLVLFMLYTRISHQVLGKIPVLNRATKYLELMQQATKDLKKTKMMKLFSIDPICWFFSGLQFSLLASAIGIQIDIIMAIIITQLISVLMFIPISPAGLGVTEGGGIVLFLLLGFTAPQAVSLILLWRVHSILFDGVTGMWDINFNLLNWMGSPK